jgi:hypothetical protein
MAIPKSKPRQTGPKTEQGKRQSSANSLQHGASAKVLLPVSIQELVKSYEAELVSHYRPSSPMVLLQIQRIATTRAKLAQLYELEQSRMAMVYKEFDENPKLVMDAIKDKDELVAALALSLITKGEYDLPYGLLPEQIKQVAKEISELKHPVATDEDLNLHLPRLCKLLSSLEVGWLGGLIEDTDCLGLLKIVAEDFRLVFDKTLPYAGNLVVLINRLLNRAEAQKEPAQVWSSELRDFVDAPKPSNPKVQPVRADDMKQYLGYFTSLGSAIDEVAGLVQQFNTQAQMMRAALSLPPEECDRLTRHQTTLERRLSTQIGELRVMLAS